MSNRQCLLSISRMSFDRFIILLIFECKGDNNGPIKPSPLTNKQNQAINKRTKTEERQLQTGEIPKLNRNYHIAELTFCFEFKRCIPVSIDVS